jgi:23S rRNA pseudouridine955/2504/2580 synthase
VKNIKILYEDDFCIILNKPAGLAVQGGEGVKSSLDKILAEIRTPAPLLVHRLDKDTSGLLLAAKGKEAAARFSGFFSGHSTGADRRIVKMYTAVCAGCPEKDEGIIKEELFIRGNLKKSETRYKVKKSNILSLPQSPVPQVQYSILEIELGTGRMHQIRRHLAMKGNPVLGDDKYGDFSLNKILQKTIRLKRLLLHASRLIIKDGLNLDIQAPLPEYFDGFL